MSTRLTYLLGFVVICALLLTSAYLQIFDGFTPCPLCSLQRISFGLLGILFFIGLFVSSKVWGRMTVNVLCLMASILGILLAGRQVWLQNFPSDDGNECGVSLQYMMQVLPFNEMMQKILSGTAECAKSGWEFFHLNMAEWSLIWFILFLLLSFYLFLKEFSRHKHH